MAGKVYRMTQVVGTSDESVIDAIQGAVETASVDMETESVRI